MAKSIRETKGYETVKIAINLLCPGRKKCAGRTHRGIKENKKTHNTLDGYSIHDFAIVTRHIRIRIGTKTNFGLFDEVASFACLIHVKGGIHKLPRYFDQNLSKD